MEIRWFGHSFFELTVDSKIKKDIKIFFDPFSEEIGLEPPQNLEADIVFVSHDHSDHNNLKAFKEIGLTIKNPGEYSVKGLDIKGIPSFHDANQGQDRGTNTIYTLEAEKIKIAHLGDLGQTLDEGQLKKMGRVNILFVPVGGPFSLNGKEAVRVIKQIEPNLIIPMHYKIPGIKLDLKELDEFIKEIGISPTEPSRRLIVKASSFEGKEMELAVMERVTN